MGRAANKIDEGIGCGRIWRNPVLGGIGEKSPVGECYVQSPLPDMVKSWKLALAVSALMLSAPSLNSALQDDGMQMGTGRSEDYYDGPDGLHGVE